MSDTVYAWIELINENMRFRVIVLEQGLAQTQT